MPDYLFEYTAFIDERKRPENFPSVVYIREQYRGIDTAENLRELYNQRFKTFVANPGIVVYPDETIIDTTDVSFDQRVYVPWHMITHFQGRVKPLVGPKVDASPFDLIPEEEPNSGKDKIQ